MFLLLSNSSGMSIVYIPDMTKPPHRLPGGGMKIKSLEWAFVREVKISLT
jgi:hypothetical protein